MSLAAQTAPQPPHALAFDAAGRLTEIDPATRALLEAQDDALIGVALADLLTEPSRVMLETFLASPETSATLRLAFRRGDHTPRLLDLTLVRSGQNAPGRAVVSDPCEADELVRLRAECEELSAYVDGSVLGTWAWNVQTGETRFNERWAGIVGYSLADLEPVSIETWARLCHPEDLAQSNTALARHFSGEEEWYEIEARMRHRDGRWIWVRDLGRVQSRTAEGHPEWMFGVHRDIDAQKQREARLQRQQMLLERAGMLAGFGCWELEIATREIFWSAETCRIHGVAPGYVPSIDEAINFYAPEARQTVRAAVEAAIRDGTAWDFELPLIRADGQRIWVRSVGEVSFEGGRPVRMSGAFQDISDRKETEQRLAEAAAAATQAKDRLNTLADKAPGAIFEHREAPSGRVDLPYFSARLPDLLGVDREAMKADGAAAARNIHPDDGAELARAIRASRDALSPLAFLYRLVHPTKGLRHMQLSSMPVRQTDGAVIWYGSVLDITDRIEIEARVAAAAEEVRHAHARLASIMELVPVGLFEFRRSATGATDFPYSSARFNDLVGFDRAQIERLGGKLLERVLPKDRLAMEALTARSAADLTPWRMRFRYDHPERGLLWLSAFSTPQLQADGSIVWTGAVHDASAEVERETELQRACALAEQMHRENEWLALHDGLTHLPNRRYFDRRIADRVQAAHAGTGAADCALIQLDIDHFKQVNDTLGHAAGDRVLQRIADLMRLALRAGDFAARLGGDEFSILLASGSSEAEARAIVETVRAGLSEPFHYRGSQCRIEVSCGIVIASDITALEDDLQLHADAALYRAKEAGRNRSEICIAPQTRRRRPPGT